MNGVSNGLWIAACTPTVCALALTLTVGGRLPHRGWLFWLSALWLGTAGVAVLAVWGQHSWGIAAAHGLLMPWPILFLLGVRRFHARFNWPGQEAHDWAVLAACGLLVGVSLLWLGESAMAALGASVGVLAVHLYTASVLICNGAKPESRPMHLMGAVIALAGCAPILASLPAPEGRALTDAAAITFAVASVAMSFIVTTLVSDRSERRLRASRRRLRTLAGIDPLTQMPNRRHFDELATRVLEHDPPTSTVLMMLDIDHFKRINDQYGHEGGDRALKLVSRCVREVLRVQDLPCRHGGDEFALLLRHATVHDAMRVAVRLVQSVQRRALDDDLPTLSLSFGIVQVRPAEELVQALRRADAALYEAKRQGRSRAVAVAASGQAGSAVTFTETRPLGLSGA